MTGEHEASGDRLIALDFIRGFAVLGILAANIVAFALADIEQYWPSAFHPLSEGSKAAWLVNFVLVDGKMRSLFAILFGAGLALFVEKADARGEFGYALQMRRLFWLALFGLAHFLFLYRGDILFAYALWGFVAMFMVRLKPALLIALGGALYLATVPLDAMRYAPLVKDPPVAVGGLPAPEIDFEQLRELGAVDEATMRDGSFVEIVEHRAGRHGVPWLSSALDALNDSFAMMLIGIALFRLRLFRRGVGSRKLLVAGIALSGVGVFAGLWLAQMPMASGFAYGPTRFYGYALVPLQRLPMTMGWLFLLVALMPLLTRTWIGESVTAAGRMAFTNYIAMSLVMGLAFQGWGLGWFGEFDRVALTGFVIAGWMLMLAWSKPWLANFHHGPLEWLWRSLLRWRAIPFCK